MKTKQKNQCIIHKSNQKWIIHYKINYLEKFDTMPFKYLVFWWKIMAKNSIKKGLRLTLDMKKVRAKLLDLAPWSPLLIFGSGSLLSMPSAIWRFFFVTLNSQLHYNTLTHNIHIIWALSSTTAWDLHAYIAVSTIRPFSFTQFN